nr:site-specific DNA-methyltransferase [Paracoccus shandongensis]
MVAGNVTRLMALFPEILVDGKVDFDVLRELLGDTVEEGEERYGLNWKGKRRARAFALTPSLGTLRPDPEDSVDWNTTQNIFVEGDNLEVLKLIRRSYASKVKLIYIDPPYNTGGDFVYPDNYRDSIGGYLALTGQSGEKGEALTSNKEASGRFHTDWLNMIYPRLILAKEMLTENGFIAVSIDHNECANLRLLMDDVFGAECFKNQIIVRRGIKNVQAQFDSIDSLSVGHEYIVIYGRSAAARMNKLSVKLKDFQPGKWDTFWRGTDRPTMRYELFGHKPESGQWRWSEDRTLEAINNHQKVIEEFGSDEKIDDYYLDRIQATNEQINFVRLNGDGVVQYYVPPTGTKLLSNNWMDVALKGSETNFFDTEKHVDLLCRIISWITDENDVILDFFAGSGTTGHAVMLQNALDSSARRFILVQIPEPVSADENSERVAAAFLASAGKAANIAELTKERLRQSAEGVRGKYPTTKIDTGFRVYKLATSNLKPWQPDTEDLEASLLDAVDNVLPGRTEDDLLVELLLKTGIDLTLLEEKREIAGQIVHALGSGTLMVCMGNIGADEAEVLGQGMADWVNELDPVQTTVYFKDTGLGADGNRAATKANLAAILRQRLGDRIAKIASI